MTRARSFLRSLTPASRAMRALLGITLAVVAWGCADKITGPEVEVVPTGHIGVYADLGPTGVTTLVIQASGPGIVKSDGSPDTLAFNINLVNGVAAGSVAIPAGPARVITAHAYIGVTETHRGSVTANILEGNNPTLQITLVPLVGNVPLTVSIGSTIVVVRPILASMAVGDTLRLAAEVRDHNGNIVSGPVRWATLNPLKAAVDTLGLVTMRDTGEVQIVATYGTVGGASRVTGASALSAAPYHLTWNGSVNTNWSEINNWTPHGIGTAHVPTLSDSVVIPAGTPNTPRLDACADNFAVRNLLIESGASINQYCGYPLNVYGSADVRGTILPTVNVRPNATIAGKYADVQVVGAGAKLSDSVVATNVTVNIGAGTFALNGHRLRTTGDFSVSNGTVTMAEGDTLIIGGNASWGGGDHAGLLTGGVVYSRGTYFSGNRYYGTGTSRLVLDRAGTGHQALYGFDYVNSPANSQVRRLEIRNRDGVDICGHIRVTDTLSFVSTGTPSALYQPCGGYYVRAQGPVVTSANTDVVSYLWDLRHVTGTSLVAGTWHASVTEFGADDAVINPALAYANLRFTARNAIPADMAISGYLYLNGTGTELDLAGNTLAVGDYLETNNGATIKMLTATDTLVVAQYASFPHDFHVTQKAKLAAGVLSVGSYLTGPGFATVGTKLVMAGTSASSSKYISGVNYESRPTQTIYDLEIAPDVTYGACERIKVAHNLVVRSGAKLQEWCSGSYIAIQNDLITEATSTVNPYLVALNSAIGTSHVAGMFSPALTDFNVADAIVNPALSYQNIRFYAPNHLIGPTTAAGYVYLTGAGVDLTINGQTLTIGDYLSLDNSATLTMNNVSDVVTVAKYASFNTSASVAENTRLTAGTLSVGEYFTGSGFSASGTHRVILTGTGPSTSKYINGVNFESRPAQAFQNLEIADGKTYGTCERIAVKGELKLNAGSTLQEWCTGSYLRIHGDVVTAAGSTLNPYDVQLFTPFGTQHVDGTFSPAYTSVYTTAAAGQLKEGLGYQNMQFFAASQLAANLTVNGLLNVSGPATVLTLNGNQLAVLGALNVQNNATLVMNNESDVLDVSGNVAWNGGGSEAGKLTQGTTFFRGETVCGTQYETGGYHTTVFDRAAGYVRFQCVTSSSTAQLLKNVEVHGTGLMLECNLNVSNNVRVATGSNLIQNCSSGTLYVGNELNGDEGSAITNGAGYPASHQLSVVFGSAVGTAHVNGAYGAHASYFTALNSNIKPTWGGSGVDYKYVRIDQSTSIQDTTSFGQLDVINNAILDLNGQTLVVRGQLNFDNTAKLRMTNAEGTDRLVVASSDPAADLFWDGGDNSTDGSPLLTNGTILYYGDRFYGPQYKAAANTPHKFIFAGNAGGSVSVEGSPVFAQMEVGSTSRAVVTTSTIQVQDTLRVVANGVLTGPNYVQVQGGLKTGTNSDVNVATVYLDGNTGTKHVYGRFRPVTTYFRATNPVYDAIRSGLEYQTVVINGPYQLANPTAFAGNLDIIGAGARLTMAGQNLAVAGHLDLHTGGTMTMDNGSDNLSVGDFARFQSSAGVSTILSAGVLSVAGPFYEMSPDVDASGSHTLEMKGSAPQIVYATQGGTPRILQNVVVSGSASVNFYYGLTATGFVEIGSREVSAPVTVAVGGPMHVTGDVSVGINDTLTVPDGSTFSGWMQTRGLLKFTGSSASTGDLYVTSVGVAQALSTNVNKFVDFNFIQVDAGGVVNNGTGGGFRQNAPALMSPLMSRSATRPPRH